MDVIDTIFDYPEFNGHKKVLFVHDQKSGLKAIIAIKSLVYNPVLKRETSLGGVLCDTFGGTDDSLAEQDPVRIALRRSDAMDYKRALAHIPFGGAKAIVLAERLTPKLLRAFANVLHELDGEYIAAEDRNTGIADMVDLRKQGVRWVSGYAHALGGSGDPSPMTARGNYQVGRLCLERFFGSDDPAGRKFVLQGAGKVGLPLAQTYHDTRGEITFSEVNPRRVAEVLELYPSWTHVKDPDAIYDQEGDMFIPCAGGGTLNKETIPRLRCPIVCGPANNQFATLEDADLAYKLGIRVAVDYVANAGGLISVADEWEVGGYNQYRVLTKIKGIAERHAEIFKQGDKKNISPDRVARQMAEKIFEKERKNG